MEEFGNGTQPTWTDQLPDDLKSNEAFTGFEKLGDMANDYLSMKGNVSDLEGKVGNSIPKLGENATTEEQVAYFKAIGRPDDVAGYNFNKPELPEGVSFDDTLANDFKSRALDLGLTQSQATGLFDWYAAGLSTSHQAHAQQTEKEYDTCVENLKASWGAEYDKNIAITTKAVNEFGGDELKQYLDESGAGNSPKLIQAFYNIGKAMSEDKLINGELSTQNRLESLKNPDTGRVVFDYPNSPGIK